MSKKVPVLDSYHITLDTYLIEPYQYGGNNYSYIYDKNGEFIVKRKPLYIIRKSCNVLGYEYKSAINYSKKFFGKEKHKLPILVSHDRIPNIFFPLFSPSSKHNIWVGLHGIANIGVNKQPAEITLVDGKEKTLPVSITSINSQYVCATMLYKYISHQKEIIQNLVNLSNLIYQDQELNQDENQKKDQNLDWDDNQERNQYQNQN